MWLRRTRFGLSLVLKSLSAVVLEFSYLVLTFVQNILCPMFSFVKRRLTGRVYSRFVDFNVELYVDWRRFDSRNMEIKFLKFVIDFKDMNKNLQKGDNTTCHSSPS